MKPMTILLLSFLVSSCGLNSVGYNAQTGRLTIEVETSGSK